MNLNKYTEKAQEAVVTAQQLAERSGHAEILPEHLLAALVDQRDGIVPAVLGKMKIDAAQVSSGAAALLTKLPKVQGGNQPNLSARLRRVVLDRDVIIPEGLVVGEDPKLDAQRFRRTEKGVCLITQSMIDRLT